MKKKIVISQNKSKRTQMVVEQTEVKGQKNRTGKQYNTSVTKHRKM